MLITFIVIGVVNACVALFMDFAMSYGHIFWKLRFDAARRAARRIGMIQIESETGDITEISVIDSFDSDAEKGQSIMFGERVDYFDKLYWWVATHNNRLVWWICVKCLSYRIFTVIFIASIVALGLGFFEAVQLLFIGSSANLITIIILTTRQGKE